MVSRKLAMQTLQKQYLSNRLYIEQVTCNLLMFLLSAKTCSETAKRNSVCLEIPFVRSSSLMETSQLIYDPNRLTGFFVMREVRRSCLISVWKGFRWAHGFCGLLGELPMNLQRLCVLDGIFLAGGLGGVSVFCTS